jgi:hypothetical protein
MPQDATCPKCKHVFPVTQARHPVEVACPGCETDLTVEYRKRPSPVDPGIPPYELLVKAGKLVATAGADAAPAPKKKLHEDDDEKGTQGTGGSMTIVVFAGLGALLLAIGGLGTTGYFLFTNLDTSDATINKLNNQAPNPGGNRPNNNNSGGNQGGNTGGNPAPPPKKTTFELQPVTGALPPIKVSPLTSEASTIDLRSKVGAVAIGGGGRYIVMHFPDTGAFGVFDANTALVTTKPMETGDVKIAAGLSRAVAIIPSSNSMCVYSLPDLNKQFEVPSPVNGLRAIAMGSRTNGPLVGIGTFGGIHLMDIKADGVKEVEEARNDKLDLFWQSGLLRATPDGRRFLTFDSFDTKSSKVRTVIEENKQWKRREIRLTPFAGESGYLYGAGVITNKDGEEQKVGGKAAAGTVVWYVPAVCGSSGAFVKVTLSGVGGPPAKKSIVVSIHNNGNAATPAVGTPVFTGLPEFEGLFDPFGNASKEKPLDQHFFLFPEAKLLAILSANRDKLLLRKIDLK